MSDRVFGVVVVAILAVVLLLNAVWLISRHDVVNPEERDPFLEANDNQAVVLSVHLNNYYYVVVARGVKTGERVKAITGWRGDFIAPIVGDTITLRPGTEPRWAYQIVCCSQYKY